MQGEGNTSCLYKDLIPFLSLLLLLYALIFELIRFHSQYLPPSIPPTNNMLLDINYISSERTYPFHQSLLLLLLNRAGNRISLSNNFHLLLISPDILFLDCLKLCLYYLMTCSIGCDFYTCYVGALSYL